MNFPAKTIKVWDLPVRLFHWNLVFLFACAYLSAEFHLGFIHTLIGYCLCLLLVARLVWGFTGNEFARFKSFIFSPTETLSYLRSLKEGHPKPYLGHNPAGALMVFALLALLTLIFLTGLATLAVIDFEGPLFVLLANWSDEASYTVRHLHAWLINVALLLIPLHLLGVVLGSVQHKENLVRAMITGLKKQQ